MLCGLTSCKRKAFRYGVCGVHKTLAYKSDNPQFLKDLEVIRAVEERYFAESKQLASEGFNILGVQGYLDDNLTLLDPNRVPVHLRKLVNLLVEINTITKDLQQKYDPYLVSNAVTRISHSYEGCGNCTICRLR